MSQLEGILDWLTVFEKESNLVVERIKFSESQEWLFSEGQSKWQHRTGGFFSIQAIRFKSNFFGQKEYYQPIINQPEIGILGFLAKRRGDQLYLLAQAKIEPGNVNIVQLAPTLQATESNYKKLHGGNVPLYLEYFLHPERYTVLVDQLQSEQGTRFIKKRNRNMVLLLPDEIELPETDTHKWISMEQWKSLLAHDHLVNTDSRSVIVSLVYSGIGFNTTGIHTGRDAFSKAIKKSLQAENNKSILSTTTILSWITKLKSHYTLSMTVVPINELPGWKITDDEISHESGNYFSVYQYKVKCRSREVSLWDQPLINTHEKGFIGLICSEIDGVLHVLLQARVEPGNFDILELTSSVHESLGEQEKESSSTYFMDLINSDHCEMIIQGLDSEEGGRFFQDENVYKIVLLKDYTQASLPMNYQWLSLNQIKDLIRFNNFFTNELRSLLALMYSRF